MSAMPTLAHAQVVVVEQLGALAQSQVGQGALLDSGKAVFQRFRPDQVEADNHGAQRLMTTIIPTPKDKTLRRMGKVALGVLKPLSKTLRLGKVRVSVVMVSMDGWYMSGSC
jgi:hypothetical protein